MPRAKKKGRFYRTNAPLGIVNSQVNRHTFDGLAIAIAASTTRVVRASIPWIFVLLFIIAKSYFGYSPSYSPRETFLFLGMDGWMDGWIGWLIGATT